MAVAYGERSSFEGRAEMRQRHWWDEGGFFFYDLGVVGKILVHWARLFTAFEFIMMRMNMVMTTDKVHIFI